MLTIDPQRDTAHVWVLLRDDRGGLSVATFTLNVQ